MRRTLAVFLALILLPGVAAACLWDRDTLADEARGLPDVVAAITGRFPRNPPLYYRMRLDRLKSAIDSGSVTLDAYDDAGVACDRLGLGDEAVEFMRKKQDYLNASKFTGDTLRDHTYRYHANLGTFLAHRWVRAGADRSKMADLEQARDEIAAALAINPDAHFGRERYQLKAIEWILKPPEWVGKGWNPLDPLPNLLGYRPDHRMADPEPDAHKAVKGLTGLIVLGNAWESVDVYHALTVALGYDEDRNTLAYLAYLRSLELVDQGRRSMHPDAPAGEALKKSLFGPEFLSEAMPPFQESFQELRAEADAWQASRTRFMLARLQAGRHPDTDPSFWEGYVETSAPPLLVKSPQTTFGEYMARKHRIGFAILVGIVLAVVLTFVKVTLILKRSARATSMPGGAGGPLP